MSNGPLKGNRRIARGGAFVISAATLAFSPLAHAQLPAIQLPNVPGVDLPRTVADTLGGVTNGLEVPRLAELRQLRVRELLRTQRQYVERDPNGAPIVRAEIVSFSPSDTAVEGARGAGFEVAREQALDGLDARIVVLRAPQGMSTRRALARLRALDPDGAYDFNHIYLDSGGVSKRASVVRLAVAELQARAGEPISASVLKVGLIDGGVDVSHPVFREAVIHQHGCADKPVPTAHGTATASLIVGRSDLFHGAAPGAELFAADVYCGRPAGGAVDAVVEAMAWIARERAPVINVSLVGPRNVMLENVVKVVIARGYIVVAAVGNDGAAAPPLYPAAFPGVVGVTGVDARQKVLLEAGRGDQVDFAAPGADMAAAMLSQSFAAVRGTSFAAPIVAGLLAAEIHEPDPAGAAQAIGRLVNKAVDLGSRGPDRVYGNGLVGNSLRVEPGLALLAPAAARTGIK